MDLELRKKWLKQQKELFGNSIYVEDKIQNDYNNFVFGIGKSDADFVFIGEVQGIEEDLFFGHAGKLLNKVMSAINLNRKDIYILNLLKFKPNHNSLEIKESQPYLKEQIRLINPKLIVTLGELAAKTLLKINLPLNDMREKSFTYEGIDVLVTYHPDALLRNPKLKRPTWEDFKIIKSNYILEVAS